MKHGSHFLPSVVLLFASLNVSSGFAAFEPANRPYDVERYSLRFTLDPAQDLKEFEGSVRIAFQAKDALDSIVLDREALTVVKIESEKGKPLKWDDSAAPKITVNLLKPLKKGEKSSFTVTYRGKVLESHRAFFKVKDPDAPERGWLYFTHFEPLSAKAFFPCNDEPYDKASVDMSVTLPVGFDAISNGKRVSDRPVKLGKGKWHEVKWVQELPHSTYLVSLAVGKFKSISDEKHKPPVAIYANEKKLDRARYALDVTNRSMDIFEKYLGTTYPWDKYSTVGLPTFLWGGMENTSSTHMNEERMLLNDPNSSNEKYHITGLVAHELAHQWFGNYVTLKWWNDVWLNEAFATYMTLVAEKGLFPNERPELEFVAETWDSYFKQEDGPRSHPIVQSSIDTPDDGFDSISYIKGANVLRMLSFYLGEERFKKALRTYLKEYGGSNATYADLFRSVERTTGEDLAAFRDSWLLQRGYPIIRYSGTWDSKGNKYELVLKQSPNHPEDKTKFRFHLPVVFRRKASPQYDKTIAIMVGESERREIVDLPAEPELVTVNPGGVVLAKVKGDNLTEKDLGIYALGDPDPIARYWASLALAENLLDGKAISTFSERTLGYVIQSDPSPYVRIALLEAIQKTPSQRVPTRLGDTLVRIAKESRLPSFEMSEAFKGDPIGWRRFRSVLLGTLGVVGNEDAVALLSKSLEQVSLPLDDLMEASRAMAQIGGEGSLATLKSALKLHSARGYRYQYHVQLAFGSLRDSRVVPELKTILASASPDLVGRLGRVISENPPVRTSPEWASTLGEFLLKDGRLGDEVKARVLTSVEKEKTEAIRQMLEQLSQQSTSERLKGLSKKILEKK